MDEIKFARGHKYLTLFYQIDVQATCLLWVGKEATTGRFPWFFDLIEKAPSENIKFV